MCTLEDYDNGSMDSYYGFRIADIYFTGVILQIFFAKYLIQTYCVTLETEIQ